MSLRKTVLSEIGETPRQVKVTVMSDHYFTFPSHWSEGAAIEAAQHLIEEEIDLGYMEQEVIHSEVVPYDPDLDFRCQDCGSEDNMGFMVHDGLWAAAGCQRSDSICRLCLEKRIGRSLTMDDYTLCPLNFNLVEGFATEERLRQYKERYPEDEEDLSFMGRPDFSVHTPALRNATGTHPELDRVKQNLAGVIVTFCKGMVNRTFHMADLLEYIAGTGIRFAPASPQRILQVLKKNGEINYTVLSRSDSLYLVLLNAA